MVFCPEEKKEGLKVPVDIVLAKAMEVRSSAVERLAGERIGPPSVDDRAAGRRRISSSQLFGNNTSPYPTNGRRSSASGSGIDGKRRSAWLKQACHAAVTSVCQTTEDRLKDSRVRSRSARRGINADRSCHRDRTTRTGPEIVQSPVRQVTPDEVRNEEARGLNEVCVKDELVIEDSVKEESVKEEKECSDDDSDDERSVSTHTPSVDDELWSGSRSPSEGVALEALSVLGRLIEENNSLHARLQLLSRQDITAGQHQ